jgi:hypothetical protein
VLLVTCLNILLILHLSLIVDITNDYKTGAGIDSASDDMFEVAVGPALDNKTGAGIDSASDDMFEAAVGLASDDKSGAGIDLTLDDMFEVAVGPASDDMFEVAVGLASDDKSGVSVLLFLIYAIRANPKIVILNMLRNMIFIVLSVQICLNYIIIVE